MIHRSTIASSRGDLYISSSNASKNPYRNSRNVGLDIHTTKSSAATHDVVAGHKQKQQQLVNRYVPITFLTLLMLSITGKTLLVTMKNEPDEESLTMLNNRKLIIFPNQTGTKAKGTSDDAMYGSAKFSVGTAKGSADNKDDESTSVGNRGTHRPPLVVKTHNRSAKHSVQYTTYQQQPHSDHHNAFYHSEESAGLAQLSSNGSVQRDDNNRATDFSEDQATISNNKRDGSSVVDESYRNSEETDEDNDNGQAQVEEDKEEGDEEDDESEDSIDVSATMFPVANVSNIDEIIKNSNNPDQEPIENDDGVSSSDNSTSDQDSFSAETLVQPNDYIYRRGRTWDGPPIVLEEFKLIFFTSAKVGCSVWKTLFRRMMHYEDWRVFGKNGIPWNPNTNGLKYLYDYDLETASAMMTSPEWTRAIFVRDPKERFVSAYLDKVVNHPYYAYTQCCRPAKEKRRKKSSPGAEFHRHFPNETAHERFLRQGRELEKYFNPSNYKHPPNITVVPEKKTMKTIKTKTTGDNCVNRNLITLAKSSPQVFIKKILTKCENSHWRRQSKRMEAKYWPYINFVGYMDTVSTDAERLLRKVGAWELYGATGWTTSDSNSTDDIGGPVFAPKQSMGRRHATNASEKLRTYLVNYRTERRLERYYASDYNHPVLNFTIRRVFETNEKSGTTVTATS